MIMKKLSELSPVKLSSGVIYIVRNGAQPTSGVTLETKATNATQIRTMMRANYYLATNTDGNVAFTTSGVLANTINGSGSLN
jgi:hypothetical protein